MNPHEELDLDFYIFMNNDLANHLLYDYQKIKSLDVVNYLKKII